MPVNKKSSSGAPKKARWTTEQRAAKGKAPARPRGGTASKPFRERSEASLEANQAMTRTQLIYSACSGLAVALGTAAVVWVAGLLAA